MPSHGSPPDGRGQPYTTRSIWAGHHTLFRNVVLPNGCQAMVIDFTADNPGRMLFHCHQQLHMAFGFMALSDYS